MGITTRVVFSPVLVLECREVRQLSRWLLPGRGCLTGLESLPSVPHLPTVHLVSPNPRQEPLVQEGLFQPPSFSPVLHVLGSIGIELCLLNDVSFRLIFFLAL